MAVGATLLVVLAGAGIVGYLEGWAPSRSFYWCIVTVTTVGYGDVVPESAAGRAAATVVMLVGAVVAGHCAGVLMSFSHVVEDAFNRKMVLSQFGTGLTQQEFATLAHGDEVRDLGLCSNEGSMSRAEFCLYMLLKLGRIETDELEAVQEVFDIYDLDNDGALTVQDTIDADDDFDV